MGKSCGITGFVACSSESYGFAECSSAFCGNTENSKEEKSGVEIRKFYEKLLMDDKSFNKNQNKTKRLSAGNCPYFVSDLEKKLRDWRFTWVHVTWIPSEFKLFYLMQDNQLLEFITSFSNN